jgi:hypothetical protein
MSSNAQVAANRENAKLSTGPVTPAGIANTRHNATRHGLTGSQMVIKGEDAAEYDSLRAELVADHAPANEHEAMLVEEIAQNWWRLQRARRVEAQVVEKFGELAVILEPEAAKAYRTINRYLNAIERSWNRACSDLQKLQAWRRKEIEERERNRQVRQEIAIRFAEHCARKENGSVSSKPQPPAKPAPGGLTHPSGAPVNQEPAAA